MSLLSDLGRCGLHFWTPIQMHLQCPNHHINVLATKHSQHVPSFETRNQRMSQYFLRSVLCHLGLLFGSDPRFKPPTHNGPVVGSRYMYTAQGLGRRLGIARQIRLSSSVSFNPLHLWTVHTIVILIPASCTVNGVGRSEDVSQGCQGP